MLTYGNGFHGARRRSGHGRSVCPIPTSAGRAFGADKASKPAASRDAGWDGPSDVGVATRPAVTASAAFSGNNVSFGGGSGVVAAATLQESLSPAV